MTYYNNNKNNENNQHIYLGVFLLQSALVISFTRIISLFSIYFKQPSVIFEIISGIILGPSVFGNFQAYNKTIFPPETINDLELVAQIGLIFYIFSVGVQLNTIQLSQNIKGMGIIAFTGMIIPFFSTFIITPYLHHNINNKLNNYNQNNIWYHDYIFLGLSLSVTALPVLACILSENKILDSQLGVITLGAAAIEEIIIWILLAIVLTLVKGQSLHMSFLMIGFLIIFCLLLFLILHPFLNWIVSYIENSSQFSSNKWNKYLLASSLMLLMVCSWLTEFIGIHPILGAFLFGIIIPRNSKLWKECCKFSSQIVEIYFLPLYFTVSGLRIDLSSNVYTKEFIFALLFVLFIGSFSKILGGMLGSLLSGFSWKKSFMIGTLMNTRGMMELIILNIGIEIGILNSSTFTIMVIMTLFSTIITSPIISCIQFYCDNDCDNNDDGYNVDYNNFDQENNHNININTFETKRLKKDYLVNDQENFINNNNCNNNNFKIKNIIFICNDMIEICPYLPFIILFSGNLQNSNILLTILTLSTNDSILSIPIANIVNLSNPINNNLPTQSSSATTTLTTTTTTNESTFLIQSIITSVFGTIGSLINIKHLQLSSDLNSITNLLTNQDLLLLPLNLSICQKDNYTTFLTNLSLIDSFTMIGILLPFNLPSSSFPNIIQKIIVIISGSSSDIFILNLIEKISFRSPSIFIRIIVCLSNKINTYHNDILLQIKIMKQKIKENELLNWSIKIINISNESNLSLLLKNEFKLGYNLAFCGYFPNHEYQEFDHEIINPIFNPQIIYEYSYINGKIGNLLSLSLNNCLSIVFHSIPSISFPSKLSENNSFPFCSCYEN